MKEIKTLKPGQGKRNSHYRCNKKINFKNENFYGNIFGGKYLDCGTINGYINSGLKYQRNKMNLAGTE